MKKPTAILMTVKIEITSLLSETEKQAIRSTIAACAVVFNRFAAMGNEFKFTSYIELHKHGYIEAKASAPNFPTAIVQQSAKNALASVRSWNSNVHHINAKRELYEAVKSGKIPPIWEDDGSQLEIEDIHIALEEIEIAKKAQ